MMLSSSKVFNLLALGAAVSAGPVARDTSDKSCTYSQDNGVISMVPSDRVVDEFGPRYLLTLGDVTMKCAINSMSSATLISPDSGWSPKNSTTAKAIGTHYSHNGFSGDVYSESISFNTHIRSSDYDPPLPEFQKDYGYTCPYTQVLQVVYSDSNLEFPCLIGIGPPIYKDTKGVDSFATTFIQTGKIWSQRTLWMIHKVLEFGASQLSNYTKGVYSHDTDQLPFDTVEYNRVPISLDDESYTANVQLNYPGVDDSTYPAKFDTLHDYIVLPLHLADAAWNSWKKYNVSREDKGDYVNYWYNCEDADAIQNDNLAKFNFSLVDAPEHDVNLYIDGFYNNQVDAGSWGHCISKIRGSKSTNTISLGMPLFGEGYIIPLVFNVDASEIWVGK